MPVTMAARIEELRTLPLPALRERYREAHAGKEAPCTNRDYLWRRLAYRMQEIELGGLSPDAMSKINGLGASLGSAPRVPLFRGSAEPLSRAGRRERRLPAPGTLIRREYKDRTVTVKVLEGAFEYEGRVFRSLSGVAKEVTGDHWNGFLFFNL
jgi:hypothetical protein